MTDTDDIEMRIAQICDDFIRFSGHPQNTTAPIDDPYVIGRVQYREGSDGPVVYYSDRIPRAAQLAILEAAYQIMITGGPELDWQTQDVQSEGLTRRFRYVDLTFDK